MRPIRLFYIDYKNTKKRPYTKKNRQKFLDVHQNL